VISSIMKADAVPNSHAFSICDPIDQGHCNRGLPFDIRAWYRDIVRMPSDARDTESGMVESHIGRTEQNGLLLIQILGLVEEEVGGQLLVLVARKVRLDDKVALEAKTTQALNSFALLFGDGDGLSTRW
jgi:hypothetical protein